LMSSQYVPLAVPHIIRLEFPHLFWRKQGRVAEQRHGSEIQKESSMVPFSTVLDCFVATLVQRRDGGSQAKSKINSPSTTYVGVDCSMPNTMGQDIGKLKFQLQGLKAVRIFDGGVEVTNENEFVVVVEGIA
jgi:hypothetical protein